MNPTIMPCTTCKEPINPDGYCTCELFEAWQDAEDEREKKQEDE